MTKPNPDAISYANRLDTMTKRFRTQANEAAALLEQTPNQITEAGVEAMAMVIRAGGDMATYAEDLVEQVLKNDR